MRNYIKKLQKKSEQTRKKILTGALFVSMIFVAFIWVYNVGYRFNIAKSHPDKINKDIRPFKLFANSLSDTYKNISASVGSIKNKTTEIKNNINETEKPVDLIVVKDTTNQ